MISIHTRIASAAVLALTLALPGESFAAAPDDLDPELEGEQAAAPTIAPLEYTIGKEIVVKNWVLCSTQPLAESIVKAWAHGQNRAQAVYADLKAAKSCGQFPELRVILRRALYQSGPEIKHDARVFSGQVNLGGGWPTGFLVYGGVPE